MSERRERIDPKDAQGANVLRGDTICQIGRDGRTVVWEVMVCHEDGTITARNTTRLVKASADTKRFEPRGCDRDLSAREHLSRHRPEPVAKRSRFAASDPSDDVV